MCKQKTKTTVPLDAVPERRTQRCSPRFRPGGRFCKLRFRYQSSPTGSEGEISRPLDHMRQIPFIHSNSIQYQQFLYIEHSLLVISSMWYTEVCFGVPYLAIARAIWRKHSFQYSDRALFKSCCVPYGTCRCISA